MALIHKRYDQSKKAIKTLDLAVKKFLEQKKFIKKNSITQEENDNYELYRDSMIKRFEYSFDTIWKYLKQYLESVCSIQLQIKGSRSIFRECLKVGLLTEQEVVLALKMIDDRNLTVHTYNEETACEIADTIPNYFELLKKCLDVAPPPEAGGATSN